MKHFPNVIFRRILKLDEMHSECRIQNDLLPKINYWPKTKVILCEVLKIELITQIFIFIENDLK